MDALNHYEATRCTYADRYGTEALKWARAQFVALLSATPIQALRQRDVPNHLIKLRSIDPDWPGREVRVIVTVDIHEQGTEEHASVSVAGGRLPTWYDLLLVRSLCWPDDVEVHQVLPAAEGENAEPYVNVAEVLHLRRRL